MAAEVNKPSLNFQWASLGAIVAPSDVKIQTGWTAEVPPFQWENFSQNRQDVALLHLFQKGISVWSATDDYYFTTNGERSYVQGSDGNIYVALQDSINQNPTSSGSVYWKNALSGSGYYAVGGGTANALTATFPSTIGSLAAITGIPLRVKIAILNTGAATLAVNGLTATAIVNPVGTALVQGQLPANAIVTVIYDGANFQLQSVQTGFGPHTQVNFAVGTTSWVCPPGVYFVKAKGWSAGGTGASGNGSNQGGGGGGAGGYGEGWYPVVPGTSYSVIVGSASAPPTTASTTGSGGGLTSFGAFLSISGGGGGAVYGGAGGAGGTPTGATFSVTGNSGSSGLSTIGGAGGSAFGSSQALGSGVFGNPAQGPGGAGSGAFAGSAGNSLAAVGALTLEY